MNRPRPGGDVERSLHRYSTGRWEGDTLIVETSRISWPHFDTVGIPLGGGATIVERFTPDSNGSRVIGMCISVRHVNAAEGEEANKEYYKEMREDVRRRNDPINIEQGLESPLLPLAVGYFKNHFQLMSRTLEDNTWLAGETFSLADISHGVYVSRLAAIPHANTFCIMSITARSVATSVASSIIPTYGGTFVIFIVCRALPTLLTSGQSRRITTQAKSCSSKQRSFRLGRTSTILTDTRNE